MIKIIQITTLSIFILNTFPELAKSEKFESIALVTSLGYVGGSSSIRKRILLNTLTSELKEYYKFVSRVKEIEELELDDCLNINCIKKIQEKFEVDNIFHLQLIGQLDDTQLNLQWFTKNENKNEEDFCESCSNGYQRKMLPLLVKKKHGIKDNESINEKNNNTKIIQKKHKKKIIDTKLWSKQFGTKNLDMTSGLAIDSLNNIYVTGFIDINKDENLQSVSENKIFLS